MSDNGYAVPAHYGEFKRLQADNERLQAEVDRLHKNMAFYKCCAMSCETPDLGSEPYPTGAEK